VYDFTPTSPFELAVHGQYDLLELCCLQPTLFSSLTYSVPEGATVRVVEEDDGSGWVKVVDESGGRGLVPASYIEAGDTTPAPDSGAGHPTVGSGKFGRCSTTTRSIQDNSHFREFVGYMITSPRDQTNWMFRRALELS